MFLDNSTQNAPEYYTSPAKLPGFKWYKPIITALLFIVFLVIFDLIIYGIYAGLMLTKGVDIVTAIGSLQGGYDAMDAFTAPGVILFLGNVAAFIPALFCAIKVSKERPFNTLITSRVEGKWDMKLFRNGLILALAINGIPQVIIAIAQGGFSHIDIKYTLPGFILFLFILPLQCMAEELLLRGFLGQTVGGWVKIPLVAIIVQALGFMVLHGYNDIGQFSILVSGLTFGIIAWKTKGLEVSSSFHIVNNWFSFVLTGIGAASISSETSMFDVVTNIVMDIIFLALMFYLDKKKNMFTA